MWDPGRTYKGMASTSVLEAIVQLYRHTGEQRYIELCHKIIDAWSDSATGSKLLSLASGATIASLPSKKAYEMTSCILGLLDMYRINGNRTYFKACSTYWNEIKTKKRFLHGGCDRQEIFTEDYKVNSGGSEGCTHVTWLQLNWLFFQITGEPKYVSELERNLFNALTGAICPHATERTALMVYNLPLDGTKGYSDGLCCHYSIPRAMSLAAKFMAGRLNNNVAILFYVSGSYQIPLRNNDNNSSIVNVVISGDYPYSGNIRIAVNNAKTENFGVQLYVPGWCGRFKAFIGEQEYTGVAGQFLNISRAWSESDTIIVDMEMTWRMVSAGPLFPGKIAVMRGPQLMSFDTLLADNAFALPSDWMGKQLYRDGTGTKWMVPFADASQIRNGPFYNMSTIVDSIVLPENITGFDDREKDIMAVQKSPQRVSISPNPFTSVLKLNFFDIKGIVDISIYDMKGRLVASTVTKNINGSASAIEMGLHNFANGVYFVVVNDCGAQIGKYKIALIR